jgi:hypothetical protein
VPNHRLSLWGCGRRSGAERSPWFQSLLPARADSLLDLFVFPCVGASAVVMYEAWSALLPDFIQVKLSHSDLLDATRPSTSRGRFTTPA